MRLGDFEACGAAVARRSVVLLLCSAGCLLSAACWTGLLCVPGDGPACMPRPMGAVCPAPRARCRGSQAPKVSSPRVTLCAGVGVCRVTGLLCEGWGWVEDCGRELTSALVRGCCCAPRLCRLPRRPGAWGGRPLPRPRCRPLLRRTVAWSRRLRGRFPPESATVCGSVSARRVEERGAWRVLRCGGWEGVLRCGGWEGGLARGLPAAGRCDASVRAAASPRPRGLRRPRRPLPMVLLALPSR